MNRDNEKKADKAEILSADGTVSNDRRRLLALMGIAATTAYVAPTLLSMDKARASGRSGGGSGSGGGRGGSGRSGGGRGGSGRSGGGRGGFGGGRGGSGRSGRGFGGGGRSHGSGNPIRAIGRAFRGIFN